MKISIYDATLREGVQGVGVAFSVADKLRVANMLDSLGVDYIEAGNPGSNPKDAEFFERAGKLKNSKLVAFGATCRVGAQPCEDANIAALLSANTPVVCVFGKVWNLHVADILKTTPEENLRMVYESIKYLKSKGREVFFDAEHFFDGWLSDEGYALEVIKTAERAGAANISLCDTRGSCFPDKVAEIVARVRGDISASLGIHAHNDTGMAEANAIAAVKNGAELVQCTLNGWGERCGNTNLFTAAANLGVKMGYDCLPKESYRKLSAVSREFCELCNKEVYSHAPYVGIGAFTHKAGMHIDGVTKNPEAFEHIDPAAVGASRNILMSEYAGRAAIYTRILEIDPTVGRDSPVITRTLEELKELEFEGYQFEGADASFILLVKRMTGKYIPHFKLKSFNVNINEPGPRAAVASATIRLDVGGIEEVGGGVGNGPINALDQALERALVRLYPVVSDVKLKDYRVRVLDSKDATASKVRVIIESGDGADRWATVGVSSDIVWASWVALADSIEYKLMKDAAGNNNELFQENSNIK
ncbi:MAG: citramalate synthase [Oscillospiraceae bacterium]|jgi:2-isopropylmalate synthase|nr:citramalate synthase [Oscillospiraceae bacterium]